MKKGLNKGYVGFIAEIKQNIIHSRYQAARLANREQLLLYLQIGKLLSEKIKAEKWGAKVLQQIADDLQNELPGLRGFSERSMKKMIQFSEEYLDILIGPSVTAQLKNAFRPSVTAQSKKAIRQPAIAQIKAVGNGLAIKEKELKDFFSISFTHHIYMLSKCKHKEERLFYIQKAAAEMWSVSTLEHQISAKLYKHQGRLPNNFKAVLPGAMSTAALAAFKDEYPFDFMSLEEDVDERVFEEKAVAGIRKFIMTLGKGFSFIGNQYKLDVGGKEYFIDLLFYNRILQCLVVFELKRGKFKPEYAGKLNFYLNVLDDSVKLQHEKPSIGIILCKEKNNVEVEYSFRSINKAMGVATYKLSTQVPKEMKGILPDADKLRKLI